MKLSLSATLGALLLLAGCASRYEITEAELQSSIQGRLPVEREFRFVGTNANLSVTHVAIHIPQRSGEKVRIAANGSMTAVFRGLWLSQPFAGEVRGLPRYDVQESAIYLADPEVPYLDAPALAELLPSNVYQSVRQRAKSLLVNALAKRPIYTISNRSVTEAIFKARGEAIETGDGKLVFQLK